MKFICTYRDTSDGINMLKYQKYNKFVILKKTWLLLLFLKITVSYSETVTGRRDTQWIRLPCFRLLLQQQKIPFKAALADVEPCRWHEIQAIR